MIEQTVARRVALGHAVREARLARGLTQQDLAFAAGTRRSRISDLERASTKHPIARESRERVAELLELDSRVWDGDGER